MKNIFIELADTHTKRELGLMNRKSLAKDNGMLFKFPYTTRLSFWMKDTYVPLDIAFLDDKGKILQIESMVPLSTRPITSSYECRYALEVNKDWFKENDIKIGHVIGGRGISAKRPDRLAQTLAPPLPTGMPPNSDPNAPQEGDMGNPPAPFPDVTLNMSMKEKLDDANMKGKNLIILYTTKWGRQLGPKTISPPFYFEPNEDGQHDKVVKAWDNQTAGWKSFLIDNIQSLEDPTPPSPKENK